MTDMFYFVNTIELGLMQSHLLVVVQVTTGSLPFLAFLSELQFFFLTSSRCIAISPLPAHDHYSSSLILTATSRQPATTISRLWETTVSCVSESDRVL